MKRIVVLAAAAAIAITATPALAKTKKKHRVHHGYYGQSYAPGPYQAGGSDPSLGHPSAAALSRATGRCVEDLGYGRFKYCGW